MLIQEQLAKSKQMTVDEFLDRYLEGHGRFELHDGVVIQKQATGTHEQVRGFLALEVGVEIKRLGLPYFIPRQGIIKGVDSDTAHSTLFMKYTRLSLVGTRHCRVPPLLSTRRKPLSLQLTNLESAVYWQPQASNYFCLSVS